MKRDRSQGLESEALTMDSANTRQPGAELMTQNPPLGRSESVLSISNHHHSVARNFGRVHKGILSILVEVGST